MQSTSKAVIPGSSTTVRYLRCPRCASATLDSAPEMLRCRSCATEFPKREGYVDLTGSGQNKVDRAYDGRGGRFYAWLMERPNRQRIDSWLLGLRVDDYYAEVAAHMESFRVGPGIEVPAGNLPFLDHTAAYARSGPWVLVDLSPTMLSVLGERLNKRRLPACTPVLADARSLPVASGEFRHVVSLFGFHCFHDKEAVALEFRRSMHPAGRLLLTTLTCDGPWRSRIYHRINQLDGTFARDNTEAQILATLFAAGLHVTSSRRFGAVLVITAQPAP